MKSTRLIKNTNANEHNRAQSRVVPCPDGIQVSDLKQIKYMRMKKALVFIIILVSFAPLLSVHGAEKKSYS